MRINIFSERTKHSRGFSVIEVIIALGISVVIVSGIIGLLTQAMRYTRWSEHRWQATSLADGAIEAAISIKENDWNTIAGYIADGSTVYSLTISGNNWSFVTNPTGEDIGNYNREITFSEVCRDGSDEIVSCGGADPADPDSRKITATITWTESGGQPRTTVIEEYLMNWQVCYARWPYTYGSNYDYDTSRIEVTGGQASLINRVAQTITNGNFATGDFTGWMTSGNAWQVIDEGGDDVASTSANPDRIGVLQSSNFVSAGQQLRWRHKGHGQEVLMTDDEQAEFNGTYTDTQWDTGNNWLELTSNGQTNGTGSYTSPTKDAGDTTSWNAISWLPQQPYWKPLPDNKVSESGYPSGNASMSDNVLLYHLDESSGGISDSSGQGNNGSVSGGVTYGVDGRYNTALDFNGSNGYISVPNTNDINTGGPWTDRTIEMWFKSDSNSGRHVLYEEGGGTRGFNIYTDGSDLYVGGWNRNEYGWAGTWLNTAFTTDEWHHVVLVLTDGTAAVLPDKFKGYLDGVEFGSGDGGQMYGHSGNIRIARNGNSRFHSGSGNAANYYEGVIDEVGIYNRDLTSAEISERYRRGANRLKYQVRSCDDVACSGENFQGPDGTSGTFYDELSNATLNPPELELVNVNDNTYFQYEATLETIDDARTPELRSVTIEAGLNNYTAIYRASDNALLERVNAPNDNNWTDVILDMSSYLNESLYIRVIDNSVDGVNGWYAVDDFRQTDTGGNAIEGYASDEPAITPNVARDVTGLTNWYSFAADNSGTGTIYYQLSNDGGTSWLYWNSSIWAAAGASDYNVEVDVNTNISAFPVGSGSLMVRAFLSSNGSQPVILDDVVVAYEGTCGP